MHFLFIEFYPFILLSECKEHYTDFPSILFGRRFNITAGTVGYEYLSNFRRNSYFFLSFTRWEIICFFFFIYCMIGEDFLCSIEVFAALMKCGNEFNAGIQHSLCFWVAASELGNSLLQGMTGVDDDHTQDRCASLGSWSRFHGDLWKSQLKL